MPYNKDLEARIQKIVSSWKNTDSKKMLETCSAVCTRTS